LELGNRFGKKEDYNGEKGGEKNGKSIPSPLELPVGFTHGDREKGRGGKKLVNGEKKEVGWDSEIRFAFVNDRRIPITFSFPIIPAIIVVSGGGGRKSVFQRKGGERKGVAVFVISSLFPIGHTTGLAGGKGKKHRRKEKRQVGRE